MDNQELLDEYRRAVAFWDRALRDWALTEPGTADGSVSFSELNRAMRTADSLEIKILARMQDQSDVR